MHRTTTSPWSLLAAVFIFALAGYSLFSFTVLQEFKADKDFIFQNIYGLRDRVDAVEQSASMAHNDLKNFRKGYELQQIETRRHFAADQSEYLRLIQNLSEQIKGLKTAATPAQDAPDQDQPQAAQSPANSDEMLKKAVSYLMAESTNTGAVSADSHKLVALAAVQAGDVIAGQRFDGGRGTDTINLDTSDNVIIDGTNFVSFESYKLDNGKANTVTVLAPGLNKLENDKLEIIADAKLDKVVLDGCLAWKKTPGKVETDWLATDTENQTRHVFVTVKVPVSIGKCDNRYAYQAMHRNFPLLWAQYLKKNAAVTAE